LSSVVKRKSQTSSTQEPPQKKQFVKVQQPSAMKILAVLPGIGDYKSSDDDSDGSSEVEFSAGMDLTGRQIRKKKECDE
jgi:hypothetical protein